MKECKICGKKIPDRLTFCPKECSEKNIKNYLEGKNNDDYSDNASATEYMKRRQAEKKAGKNTKQKQVKSNEVRNDLDFQILISGDGMQRRDHNIDVIKNYVTAGLSFNETWKRVRRKLTSRKLEEYYNIVLDEIKNES